MSSPNEVAPRRNIDVETWSADYGSPLLIDEANPDNGRGELVPEEGYASFQLVPAFEATSIAFVEGVRHGEAPLNRSIGCSNRVDNERIELVTARRMATLDLLKRIAARSR